MANHHITLPFPIVGGAGGSKLRFFLKKILISIYCNPPKLRISKIHLPNQDSLKLCITMQKRIQNIECTFLPPPANPPTPFIRHFIHVTKSRIFKGLNLRKKADRNFRDNFLKNHFRHLKLYSNRPS